MPQPKSAPDDTAVKEAVGGRGKGGVAADSNRAEAAGMEGGVKSVRGGMVRVMAAEEEEGDVALKGSNEKGQEVQAEGEGRRGEGGGAPQCI